MLLEIAILLTSLVLLLIFADMFVDASVFVAERFRVSKMLIGLTVVAVGTSLPEVAASLAASFSGLSDIALGNVIGSNICNVGLIIGLPALFTPIVCRRSVLLREGTIMVLCTLLLWLSAIAWGEIGLLWGIVALVGFAGFVYLEVTTPDHRGDAGQSHPDRTALHEVVQETVHLQSAERDAVERALEKGSGFARIGVRLLISLAVILVSSEYLVTSASNLARMLHVSDTIIALSMIALGTSLPELAVSISAARRGEGDIVVGNIVGSNITNLLLVLGLASLVNPLRFSGAMLGIDLPLMLIAALSLYLFLYQRSGVTRGKAIFLLCIYIAMLVRCVVITA